MLTIVSPHPDDAAVSLGATLFRWNARHIPVHVITCFTDSNWAPQIKASSQGDVRRIRELEDTEFLRLIPCATHTRLRLPDVSLRTPHRPYSDAVRREDEILITRLAAALRRHRRGPLLLPLGLVHLDHKLARRAALSADQSRVLAFYEDLPYSLWLSERRLAAAAAIFEIAVGPLRQLRLGHSARSRQAALDCYPSQFDGRQRRQLARSLRGRGGERIWATTEFCRALGALYVKAQH